MIALIASLAFGQVILKDEGAALGAVNYLNCSGAGVTCTKSGSTGTLTIAGGGTDGGTVTSVSVVTANGVSGSVATPTTTPAITLTLGAITPSSVASAGSVTGSNLSGTNTGDQTITLTGGVTGSGTGSFATTVVTNANLTGPVTSIGNATTIGAGQVSDANLANNYSGVGTCSNQFARALNDNAAPTCAGVAPTDLTATGTPSATTYLRGDNTWATPAGGSGNAVEVTVTMPADGSGWAQTVVTGQTWVTSTSKIVCQPFNDGGDSNNTDEVYSLAEFAESVSTRVAGTGFTLTARSPNGVTGTFKFHCLGV